MEDVKMVVGEADPFDCISLEPFYVRGKLNLVWRGDEICSLSLLEHDQHHQIRSDVPSNQCSGILLPSPSPYWA